MGTTAAREAYETPAMIEVGSVQNLTAGPSTPWAESPSGQTSTHSDDAIPFMEAE